MLFLFRLCDFCLFCSFQGQGYGAKGENEYEFSLEFLKPVKPEVTAIFPLYCCEKFLKTQKRRRNMKRFVSTGETQIHPAAGEYHSKEAGARLVASTH